MSFDINDHLVPGVRNDPAAIARVLEKAADANGVILYFHGGLSSEAYIRNDLGPHLLRTIFRGDNTDGLHPIFVTYDTALFDPEKIRDFLRGQFASRLINWLAARLGREINQEAVAGVHLDDAACYAIGANLLARAGMPLPEAETEDGTVLPVDENFDRDITQRLVEQDEEFRQIIEEMIRYSQPDQPEGLGDLRDWYDRLRLLGRITRRFMNGTHHDFVPTITEEFVRQLDLFGAVDVGEFVFHHWETVYEHAQDCWRPGRGGHALLAGLAELRRNRHAQGKRFVVNAMSHSAGSIVICRLLEHLSSATLPQLDKAALVAPAVNQTTFANSFLENRQAVGSARFYVLDEASERSDNLVPVVYPASLLYFVSGAAERKGDADRMLLIARHLDRNRRPYRNRGYQGALERAGLGTPVPVWRYFTDHPETLVYCPGNIDGRTHEGTKLPEYSPLLAQSVLKFFTGKHVPVSDIVLAGEAGRVEDA